MSIIDTWLGIGSKRDSGNTVRSDTAPTYSDVKVTEGVKGYVANPPKPLPRRVELSVSTAARGRPLGCVVCVEPRCNLNLAVRALAPERSAARTHQHIRRTESTRRTC